MMGFFGDKGLKKENQVLREELKNTQATLEDVAEKYEKVYSQKIVDNANYTIRKDEIYTDHRIELANARQEVRLLTETLEDEKYNIRMELESDYVIRSNELEEQFVKKEIDLDIKAAKELAAEKKALRAEYESKINGLEKEVSKLTSESADFKGRYEGTLLVIKSLEKQLTEANATVKQVLNALPDVKANITSGNQSVTVNPATK
jgi:chromosome segregation ATPase